MDVAGPLLHGRENDGIDQLDDRAVLVGQLLQGNDLFLIPALLLHDLNDEPLGGVSQHLEGGLALPQGFLDGAPGGGEYLDLFPQKGLDGVDRADVRGVGDGDFDELVLSASRGMKFAR